MTSQRLNKWVGISGHWCWGERLLRCGALLGAIAVGFVGSVQGQTFTPTPTPTPTRTSTPTRTMTPTDTPIPGVCGNGVIEAGEQCDDGNTNDGEGCNSTCQIEPCFDCSGEPSVCVPGSTLGNGSFELGTYAPSNNPSCWTKESFQPATFTWDDTTAQAGSRSVKIEAPTANDASWQQTVSVTPDTNYRLSAWIKTQDVAHSLELVDAGANLTVVVPVTFDRSAALFGTNDWTFTTFDFNSGMNTQVTVAARLGFFAGTTTGTVWFDNLALAACGNSIIEPGEDCDLGVDNGSSSSCCTATCLFRAAGNQCRGAASACDIADTCTGSNATCPSDIVQPAGFPCPPPYPGCTAECDGIGTCELVSCDALSLTVNTTTDSSDANPGDAICADLIGDCSLRAAIQEANVYPGTDTINLPAGTYVLSIPGRDENAAASGDLDVLDGLKIIGNNAVIDGNDLDRVFDLRMGAVTLTGLTIIGGDNIDSGGGLSGGGGIRTLQSLTLKESTVTGNQSSGRSGGIEAGGTLLIINSTVSANSSGNSAGGIGANAQVTLVGSTVSGNTSVVGGGINSEQTLTLINSTVSDNNASFGAGVRNGNPGGAAAVFLRNSTIAGNSASSSGGGVLSFTSPIEARNTILAGNSGGTGADCSGTIVSQGYNLIQDLSGCTVSGDSTGNLTGVPAGLGPLASNGGPTSTRVLLPTSLARDAGNPALPGSGGSSCETTDQRGALRPTLVQGRCDIGAYEAPPANTCGNGIIEPTDSPANCDAGSAVVTVDPQGGSVQTPNERVTLSIPPGAVSTTTTLSITDTAPGAGLSLGAVTISARPHDQTFQEPVTFTFKWADRDNDGLVDLGACQEDETLTCDANGDCASNQCSVPSSNMDERSLVLRRNGQRFSSTGFGPGPYGCDDHLIDSSDCELAQASCADSPGTGLASVAACCNPMTNSWTFHTCSFSNDTAAPNTAGKVPGKGPVLTDCHAEWSPDLARLALDKQKGADGQRFPHYVQTCADGDDCDKDRLKDGVCTFEVLVAVNVGDVRLKDKRGVACAPTRVKKWKINSPKPDQLDVVMRNNALNMIDRVQCLATPDAVGCPKPLTSTVQGNTVSFIDAPVNRPDHETRLVQLRVPLRNPAAKKDPGRCQQDPKSCKRGTLGLRTQTVIVPSGADEALCLANADDKKCIKDNDKLNLICEPPLR